ncbi:HupE/UreJ family protein [Zeaxanthinibacter enoshimensis]|uniref:HupE/UreJ protein n=1 Tax=Zeaxanthinibacter enoshimensis TaxID=392009 RepID=A0A4V3D417_9FLAO|nr:HupE/UreJ family protein [Zeaxanthinibacter enoshimensis]TDQ32631.1 HupE/UreJ protein [Zeaxanthinibacter enoshimensis]
MGEFGFYVELGYKHVMDPGAYDHILYLAALALPFTFRGWKKVLFLATVFTIFHCTSLALSVYELFRVPAECIEFLIPITIVITAVLSLMFTRRDADKTDLYMHCLSAAFFGLIHGFGFSNYFNMLMAGEESKAGPLLGFATGIELSQLVILLVMLGLTYLFRTLLKVRSYWYITVGAIIIGLATIPMLIDTFPNWVACFN